MNLHSGPDNEVQLTIKDAPNYKSLTCNYKLHNGIESKRNSQKPKNCPSLQFANYVTSFLSIQHCCS